MKVGDYMQMHFESGMLSLEGLFWGKLEFNVGDVVPWACVCRIFSPILVLAVRLFPKHCAWSIFSWDRFLFKLL